MRSRQRQCPTRDVPPSTSSWDLIHLLWQPIGRADLSPSLLSATRRTWNTTGQRSHGGTGFERALLPVETRYALHKL
jgi:hypothetical protein